MEIMEERLSLIIKSLNEAFGTDFSDEDKIFVGRMIDSLKNNEDLKNKIQNNDRKNVEAIFERYFDDVMTDILNSNANFYKKVVDNEKLRNKLRVELSDLVYSEHKLSNKHTYE